MRQLFLTGLSRTGRGALRTRHPSFLTTRTDRLDPVARYCPAYGKLYVADEDREAACERAVHPRMGCLFCAVRTYRFDGIRILGRLHQVYDDGRYCRAAFGDGMGWF